MDPRQQQQQYQQTQYGPMDQTAFDMEVQRRTGWKKEGPVAQTAQNFDPKVREIVAQNSSTQQVAQAYVQSPQYAQQQQAFSNPVQPVQMANPGTVTPMAAAPQMQQVPPIPQAIPPVPVPQDADNKDSLVGKKSQKNSTQNNLQIAEIRDGIVIMSDGSFRAVAMAQSINFDLMSPQERESVEYAYQSFLNSLYFPIQVYVRSTKINMRPYIEKLEKLRNEQDNMLLALLMEDYTYFISQLVQQTNIMDKSFYIIVGFHKGDETRMLGNNVKKQHFAGGKKTTRGIMDIFKFKNNPEMVTVTEADIEEGKSELKNRVSAVVNGLANIGVQSVPLNTEELIELYYDVYNPDTATRQKLKLDQGLMAPVITKGVGEAPRFDQENS